MNEFDSVWIFHGAGGRFASAVFPERDQAIAWIERYALSGVLTRYPVGVSIYDWATEQGHFKPKSEKDASAEFIGRFSSAAQEHWHFENGSADAEG